jgi:hypothetical protein
MAWQDKLQVTRRALADRPEMAIVFDASSQGASEDFLRTLIASYPFLSQDYLDFLKTTDGLQIDMCVMYGSGMTPFRSIVQAANMWRPILDLSRFCPIGEDVSGRCFALNCEGEVWRFDHDPPDPANARKLASSFSEFLDNVLMGSRFVELFDGYWQNRRDNEWTQHMRHQGWL